MTFHEIKHFVAPEAYALRDMLQYTIPAFATCWILEKLTKARTSQYRSKNFLYDFGWWTYNMCVESRLLAPAVIAFFISGKLSFLNIHIADHWPVVPRYLANLVVMDLIRYWVHRSLHATNLLWSFHTTHHSQEVMSFITASRSHPVENFMYLTCNTFVFAVLGSPPAMWMPLHFVLLDIPDILHHSEVPWRFGPWLSRILVSPAFHSLHHSNNVEHQGKNFGVTFSCWDFMFGTAVDAERATSYGIDGLRMNTVRAQLLTPFVLAYKELIRLFRREPAVAVIADAGD